MSVEIPAGTLVDHRYVIQKVLGKGGFGRTYLASDTRRFDDLCVLKEFVPLAGDPFIQRKSQELFRREAETLYGLDHSQIPRFHACFEEDGRLFIVQDYVEGDNYWKLLQVRRRSGTPFTEAEVLQWLQDLLPVLSYIHGRKIIHRDISPDNILLSRSINQPVLIDFGVVRQVVSEIGVNQNPASIVGKYGYAPMEQIRMGVCSPSSDLYALAVTAIVLLTGKDPATLMDSNLEWQWHSFVTVSDRFAAVLNKMLAEKPQHRYQAAQTVLNDLFATPDAAPPISPPPTAAASLVSPPPIAPPASARPITTAQPASLSSSSSDLTHPLASAHPVEVGSPAPTIASQSTHSAQSAEYSAEWSVPPSPSLNPTVVTSHAAPASHPPHVAMPPSTRLKPILLGVFAGLAIGSIVISTQSAHIPVLCQQFNHCASEQFQGDYQAAVDQATAAQTTATNAKSLQELQQAQVQLQGAIDQLQQIPADAGAYAEAQRSLAQSQTALTSIQSRIDRENQAAELLSQAQTQAQAGDQTFQTATSAAEYESAKSQWQAALTTLRSIPQDSFVTSQVPPLTQSYQAKIQQADQQISQLTAPSPAADPVAPIASDPVQTFDEPIYEPPPPEPIDELPPEPIYEAPQDPVYQPPAPAPARSTPLW